MQRPIMRIFISIIFLSFSLFATAQESPMSVQSKPDIGFSIIKTGKISVLEGLLKPGGSFLHKIDTNFSAFLIKHHDDYLLFDTGLGSQIDAQYDQEMPYWQRPFFSYDKTIIPASEQLKAAAYPSIKHVILSHSHWDHAGALGDFPEAIISVSADEMANIAKPTTGAGGTWASQVSAKNIRWNSLVFQARPYKGYEKSLDLYQDGSIVLVPMAGHTAGSIGMFVTLESGVCYFFIGDVAWTVDALKAGAAKFWAAGMIVDQHAHETQKSIQRVRTVMQDYPATVIVPAHDSQVQKRLGYFPDWIK
ncbi:MAG: MBL fold metallo-hydrolase [Burkholderiales bacterium]|nr:MBL fold metallo-hydrolase [Burkholderiales bacterium]